MISIFGLVAFLFNSAESFAHPVAQSTWTVAPVEGTRSIMAGISASFSVSDNWFFINLVIVKMKQDNHISCNCDCEYKMRQMCVLLL